MTSAKIILGLAQRQCLEGLSNRRPQPATDAARDELIALGLVAEKGGAWALTPQGKKALSSQSNKRNARGFSF
jgi:HrpA-like RNA helicase